MFVRNHAITHKITLETSPSSKHSDGSYPIVLQLTHKRRVYRKRTGFRAYPDQWDNERYVSDRRIVRDYVSQNEELNDFEDKAVFILNKNFKNAFDYTTFSGLMDKDSEESLYLCDVIQTYIDELDSQERAGSYVLRKCFEQYKKL